MNFNLTLYFDIATLSNALVQTTNKFCRQRSRNDYGPNKKKSSIFMVLKSLADHDDKALPPSNHL